MIGGACSLCGSEGVNKSTCPKNPAAKNPKPHMHDGIAKPAPKAVAKPAPKRQLLTLPVEMKLEIMEKASDEELFNLTNTSKELQMLACDVYRRRYKSSLTNKFIKKLLLDDANKLTVTMLLRCNLMDPNMFVTVGQVALTVAAKYGSIANVKILLNRGANPNGINKSVPLLDALAAPSHCMHTESMRKQIISVLLSNGAKASAIALRYAIQNIENEISTKNRVDGNINEKMAILRLLLEHGAQLNAKLRNTIRRNMKEFEDPNDINMMNAVHELLKEFDRKK